MMNAHPISTAARPLAHANGRQSLMVYRSQDAGGWSRRPTSGIQLVDLRPSRRRTIDVCWSAELAAHRNRGESPQASSSGITPLLCLGQASSYGLHGADPGSAPFSPV